MQRQPGKFVQTHFLRLGSFLSVCSIPGPFVAQVESPNTQASPAVIASWVPLAIASLVLIGALITLVATWLRLRTANTERQKAETERTTAEIQLKAEQEARARAENQLEIEQIVKVFDRSKCSGSVVCRDVVCLAVCKTFEQAVYRLESLTKVFRSENVSLPQADIEWAQEEVARVCDGNPNILLIPPEESRLVETKAFECYSSIVPRLNEAQVNRAIEQLRGWVRINQGHESRRLEAVRLLLRSLLHAHPDNRDLLTICDEAIRSGRDANEDHKQNVAIAALTILPTVNGIGSHDLYMLLQTGLSIAERSWGVFGVTWSQAVRDSLEGTARLEKPQLTLLANQVSSHIQSQKTDILTNGEREREYMALCSVLAHIHTALGDIRSTRPKNRHIIPPHEPVEVRLTFIDSAGLPLVVLGNLGNFSVTEPRPGAWVTSFENGGLQGVLFDQWTPATMSLDAVSGLQTDFEVQVKGPLPEEMRNHPFGHPYGYRLRLVNLSSDNMRKLEELWTRFPITQ